MSRAKNLDDPLAETASEVVDDGALHKYFAAIPHTVVRGIYSHDLSLPARWLYVYLKSVSGGSPVCNQGTRMIAKGSRLGISTVSSAKEELINKGLIKVQSRDGNKSDSIILVNIWRQNFEEFDTSPKPVSSVETSSNVYQPGAVRSGVTDVQPSEENTNTSLTHLVDALRSVVSEKENSANPAEIKGLLSTISSLLAKAVGQESTTSNSSVNAATKSITTSTDSECSPQEHLDESKSSHEILTEDALCSPQEHPGYAGVHHRNTQGMQVFTTGTQCSPQELSPPHTPPLLLKNLLEKSQKKTNVQVYTEGFQKFWVAYPVKKGKDKAWEAWKRKGLDAIAPTIVASVEAHKQHDSDWAKGFIKHPATYLNGGCWTDELAPLVIMTNGIVEFPTGWGDMPDPEKRRWFIIVQLSKEGVYNPDDATISARWKLAEERGEM